MCRGSWLLFVVLFAGLSVAWLLAGRATGEAAPGRWQGVVLDPAGAPVRGATIRLRTPDYSCLFRPGHSFRSTTTRADGRFELEAPPTAMEICVEHPDFAPTRLAGGDDLEVRLRSAAWIETELPGGSTVRVAAGMRTFDSATAPGAVRLGPLPPGVPLLVTISSDRARTQQQTLTLGAGETHILAVRLAAGRSVRGHVVPRRAGVVLSASQGEARQSRAVTAADGSFEIRGLRSGATRIVVIVPGAPVRVVDCDAGDTLTLEVGP